MCVNSEILSLLASGSLNAAFHVQTRDCRITADTSSILIKLSSIFIMNLLSWFQNMYLIL
jgi:hypothetical protein